MSEGSALTWSSPSHGSVASKEKCRRVSAPQSHLQNAFVRDSWTANYSKEWKASSQSSPQPSHPWPDTRLSCIRTSTMQATLVSTRSIDKVCTQTTTYKFH